MSSKDYSAIETLEQMPLPSVQMLPDTTVVDTNEAYCRMLNASKAELIGQRATDFANPDVAEHLQQVFAQITPENPSMLSGRELINANGVSKWLIWSNCGIFDEEGKLRLVWSFSWDVTEERRYSDALERLIRLTNDRSIDTETMLNDILKIGCDYYNTTAGIISREDETTLTPTYVIDPEHFVNVGQPIPFDESFASIAYEYKDIFAIDDLSATAFTDRKCYKRNPIKRYIGSQIHIDGHRFGTLSFSSRKTSATKFSAEDVQLCKLLVQWVSFTLARQKQIDDISKNEELYRQVFDLAPIMMHTITRDRKVTNLNNMWLETLGYDKADVIGKDVTNFLTPESVAQVKIEIDQVFDGGISGLHRNFRSNDGSIVETEVASLKSMSNETLAVLTDVTDRNRAQRSLLRGNAELVRANEGLKRFNAIAAHDLQEPLRKIGIFGGILEEALINSDNTEVLESLMVVVRSSRRLSKLVQDLLTYSQQSAHSYSRERLDLNALLSSVLTDMDLKIRETGAKITIKPLPPLRGDRVPIERLFFNLINNALTYNRLGHPPEIDVFSTSLGDGGVEITIRDNGIGIPPDALEKIFEPFARLQPTAFSGSGIGLAMCKSIAEGHGWHIHCRPREGIPGSDFTLTIPRASVLDPQ